MSLSGVDSVVDDTMVVSLGEKSPVTSVTTGAMFMESSDKETIPNRRKKGAARSRTQSESAVWARASFKMGTWTESATTKAKQNKSIDEGKAHNDIHSSLTHEEEDERSHTINRHSLPCNPTSLDVQDIGTLKFDNEDVDKENDDKMDDMATAGPKSFVTSWLEQGQISERASQILEDARLSMHGNEKNLYKASSSRLSESLDEVEHTIWQDQYQSESTSNLSAGASATATDTTAPTSSSTDSNMTTITDGVVPNSLAAISSASMSSGSSTSSIGSRAGSAPRERAAPRTLSHEYVRWEGVLTKRSEWLRRLEKRYYVLEGKFLRRFASKAAYLASRDEPVMQEGAQLRQHSVQNAGIHLYTLAGVKESTSRPNGFTFITEDKKTLQLQAPTPVEKIIWIRLGLEAIVAIPNLPVAPLDIEEFYAMLVVFYTAYKGNWRTDGDMAVTLPPPSEQVFTRFFRLLDKDIIFTSNYPPSVPFHGSYRGFSGLIEFMHHFSQHTIWSNFKIGGLSIDGMIAVASGKEELENKKDNRKFIQNWVHKFTFSSTSGRLARFEINGDVVAASAVFKIPGAATTLKLPQDFNEVDTEKGKKGTILVRVMQAHGLKMGIQTKKNIKEPIVSLRMEYKGAKPVRGKEDSTSSSSLKPSSGLSALSMPVFTRKLSTSMGLLSSSSDQSNHEPNTTPYVTGQPKSSSACTTNPVWNSMISIPFENVIGVCTLLVEVFDKGSKGSHDIKIGHTAVNISKYIMQTDLPITKEQEEKAMASDSRWYSISNTKGEFCGKISLGITCRIPQDLSIPKLNLTKSVSMGATATAAATTTTTTAMKGPSQMIHWDSSVMNQCPNSSGADSSSSSTTSSPSSGIMEENPNPNPNPNSRRHGWANVKLSPETIVRTRSDGSTNDTTNNSNHSHSSSSAMICKENENMHTFMVCGAPFTIPRHYQLIKVCGRGAYGIVIAATNTFTGGNVAIKKVIDCMWHPHQLKQILREVRLIRHMQHENILSLMDLIPPFSYADFRDVYMTIDLMEMDLHRVIYSKEVLLDDHIRYFLYQILSGLNHMHQAGVLHRDLKPSNLLINSDCQLKICDLGLARTKDFEEKGMTEYVVTRWYRAPELLLGSTYDEGVDLWATGCIFAEMLGRKPLFPGETYVHQLQLIMNMLGVPEEHSFQENPLANKFKGRQLLSRTQATIQGGMDLTLLFPNANPEGLDLLWKMLVFDKEKRISVQEALQHPYLSFYYNKEKEEKQFVEVFQSQNFEELDETELKELMFKEICHFHPEEMEKRARQLKEQEILPPGWVKRESRSVPGKFYYSHPKRGISTWIKEEMD